MVHAPDPALVRAVGALHRLLFAGCLRSNILDTINEDYVRTARAKGLSERRILIHHVLRNSLIPVVSLFGLDFAAVIGGGAILTETVFNLQGVGQYAANSIQQLDVPPVLVDHHVRRVLRGRAQRRRRHHLRRARPEDQAERITSMAGPLLEIDDLKVDFATDEGTVHAVDGVSFSLEAGEVLSIVGESGSGKSVTAMTTVGLTRGAERADRGVGALPGQGADRRRADEELQAVRGDRIAMVFQDPMSSFNPVHKIGDQIVEAIQAHHDIDKAAAHRKAVEALGSVGHPATPRRGPSTTRSSSPAACASGR